MEAARGELTSTNRFTAHRRPRRSAGWGCRGPFSGGCPPLGYAQRESRRRSHERPRPAASDDMAADRQVGRTGAGHQYHGSIRESRSRNRGSRRSWQEPPRRGSVGSTCWQRVENEKGRGDPCCCRDSLRSCCSPAGVIWRDGSTRDPAAGGSRDGKGGRRCEASVLRRRCASARWPLCRAHPPARSQSSCDSARHRTSGRHDAGTCHGTLEGWSRSPNRASTVVTG